MHLTIDISTGEMRGTQRCTMAFALGTTLCVVGIIQGPRASPAGLTGLITRGVRGTDGGSHPPFTLHSPPARIPTTHQGSGHARSPTEVD